MTSRTVPLTREQVYEFYQRVNGYRHSSEIRDMAIQAIEMKDNRSDVETNGKHKILSMLHKSAAMYPGCRVAIDAIISRAQYIYGDPKSQGNTNACAIAWMYTTRGGSELLSFRRIPLNAESGYDQEFPLYAAPPQETIYDDSIIYTRRSELNLKGLVDTQPPVAATSTLPLTREQVLRYLKMARRDTWYVELVGSDVRLLGGQALRALELDRDNTELMEQWQTEHEKVIALEAENAVLREQNFAMNATIAKFERAAREFSEEPQILDSLEALGLIHATPLVRKSDYDALRAHAVDLKAENDKLEVILRARVQELNDAQHALADELDRRGES